jgi:hypothetical protein
LASLAAKVLNYFLAPLVVLFANTDGWLPSWLSWFQTPDNSLDGDTGWLVEHWQWRHKLPAPLARYIGRVGWLWRNSLYGFKIDVLGVQLGPYFYYQHKGNQSVSDNPYTPGWVYRTIRTADEGQIAFQFYLIAPTLPGKCLRVGAGWKLWQNPKVGDRLQLFLTFNPLKSRG